MVGVLIVTHSNLGSGLINAIELIMGKQQGVKTIGLYHGDGVDDFEKKVSDALIDLDDGDGVLGFVDFLGGTPANSMLKCMRQKQFSCITGVNMPMLLEAVSRRNYLSLDELEEEVLKVGLESIGNLKEVFNKVQNPNENDF